MNVITICIRALHTLLITLMVAFSPLALSGASGDYLSYDGYYRAHPQQLNAVQALTTAVRNDPDPIATAHETVRIGIIYPSLQVSDYWPRSIASFEKRLQALGIRYTLETRFTKPNTEVDKQIQQIEELLAWQPDYLIYTLDSARQRSMVERLIRGTDTKLILQNITTPVREWGEKQPFMYIGFDHAEGAKILARYHKSRIPQGTGYGVVFRSKGLVSEMRGQTYIQEVGNYHHLKASYYTDSSRTGGYEAALRMLNEHPDIGYIYACSTDTALGSVDALKALGRDDVIVNGWGGGAAELDALRRGELQVVLMRMNDDNGVSMAEAIKRDLQGLPVPLIYSGDFTVLDASMSGEEISEIERKAFRYSGITPH